MPGLRLAREGASTTEGMSGAGGFETGSKPCSAIGGEPLIHSTRRSTAALSIWLSGITMRMGTSPWFALRYSTTAESRIEAAGKGS